MTGQRINHTNRITSVTAPTCLIWGDADPISPLGVGEHLHRSLPRSTLHVLSGGTHSLARDRPDEVTPLIVEHLR
jgi:pimeloyl-ACP methyl ester carboxylesterase